ncbi:MAG: flagellar protein FlaG [Candidatus Desulforudis sp.]|nr:flagellar protein FlaG [Desulforudis sp.]
MKIGAGGLQSLAQYEAVARRGEGADRVNAARELMLNPAPTGLRDMVRAVERLNRLAELFNQQLLFRVNRETEGRGHKRPRIRMINRETGETLRELDPEEIPALARHISDVVGLIIDTET